MPVGVTLPPKLLAIEAVDSRRLLIDLETDDSRFTDKESCFLSYIDGPFACACASTERMKRDASAAAVQVRSVRVEIIGDIRKNLQIIVRTAAISTSAANFDGDMTRYLQEVT